MIHIALCLDDNFLLPALVTINSICANNKSSIWFHIVESGLSDNSKTRLSAEIERCGSRCSYYYVDDSLCSHYPIGRPDQPARISVASYFRLFLPSLLPSDIDKVLYLDCDIIVRDSLEPLWDIGINDYSIGVVSDMCEMDPQHYDSLHLLPKFGYFNAGVLLINLKKWRAIDAETTFVSFAMANPEKLINHDQDILNYVFKEDKYQLPLKYNVQDGALYERPCFVTWYRKEELEEAIKNPCIIHFCTEFKPWGKDCDNPYRAEYLKYVELAGCDLSLFPKKKDARSFYQREVRPRLVKLGVLGPLRYYNSYFKKS